MQATSQTDHERVPPLRSLGSECFATVLLVEAAAKVARAVETSLDGVLGDALRFECVAGLAEARARLASGAVEVILVGTNVSDCERERALEQLVPEAPEALILPLSTAELRDMGADPPECDIDAHWLPRMLNYGARRRQVEDALGAADDALFEEMERSEITLSSIGDAVFVTDAQGQMTCLNATAEALTGWSTAEASGRALSGVFRIVDAHTRHPVVDPAECAMSENGTVMLDSNCVLLRHDGSEAGIEGSAAPSHDRHGAVSGAVIVFRNVRQSATMIPKTADPARHDSLTGRPNRALLNERLTQAIRFARRHDKRVALLFVDMNGFEEINDSLGYVGGDHMLQAMADTLSTCVRATGTVSRLGGDEFVILLTEIDGAEDAEQVASKVIMLHGEPLLVDDHRLEVSLSVGVSVCREDGETVDDMRKHVDAAMYRARSKPCRAGGLDGATRRVFGAEAGGLEGRLRGALEKDEFVLDYQPQGDLTTGAVVGLEALLRWRDPERGLIGPNQFIALAERTGHVVPIGQWVLAETCRQVRAWQAAGLEPPPVAINVSAVELRQYRFAAGVAETLRESGVDAGRIRLELPESVLMPHADGSLEALRELKNQGVGLAIDGFGTGHSSPDYLRRFPVDTIKVHRSLLEDVATVSESGDLLRTILERARNLRHRAIAQGVETEEQLSFLQAEGCPVGQGFYLGSAGDGIDIALLLATHRPRRPAVSELSDANAAIPDDGRADRLPPT